MAVILEAHRGVSAYYPENTLAAFRAFAMGHGCHKIDSNCGSHGLDMEEDLNIVHLSRVCPAKA